MIKIIRYLFFPLSFIYGAIVQLRNWLFDKNIFKSASFNFPVICVGNLATGGTGKTPMTEYLVELLQKKYNTATLSRGYKRKTKGFAIAGPDTTAIDIGDEPMQFHKKYPGITVAVGEERLVAIPQLLHDKPGTEVIILDDAFQHRTVRAGLNILLTDYKNLYTRDALLPVGDLRDTVSSSKRADTIVVTKCNPDLNLQKKKEISEELKPLPHQSVFFTKIEYGQPYHLFNNSTTELNSNTSCLLLCGIANPKSLKEFLETQAHSYEMLRYPDHHIFNSEDLKDIKNHFENIRAKNKIIITTEKDAVRLHKFEKELADFPVYVLPIKHSFLFSEGKKFEEIIFNHIKKYYGVAAETD